MTYYDRFLLVTKISRKIKWDLSDKRLTGDTKYCRRVMSADLIKK